MAAVVQVNSPYLEEHLMHMIKQDQNKVHNMDLLWRYYEKNRSFGKAAHVLARLADMQRLDRFFLISICVFLFTFSHSTSCFGGKGFVIFWSDHAALRSH